jgi:hypothetical protein
VLNSLQYIYIITAQVALNEEASYWSFLRLAMVVTWLASEAEFLVLNCCDKLSKELASTPMRLEHVPQASGAQVEQCLNFGSVSLVFYCYLDCTNSLGW